MKHFEVNIYTFTPKHGAGVEFVSGSGPNLLTTLTMTYTWNSRSRRIHSCTCTCLALCTCRGHTVGSTPARRSSRCRSACSPGSTHSPSAPWISSEIEIKTTMLLLSNCQPFTHGVYLFKKGK